MNSLLIFNFLWIKNNIGSTAAVYIPRGPYLCGSSTDTSSKRRRRSTQSHSQVAVCSFFSRVVQIRWNVDQEEHNGGANDEEALEYSNDSLEGPLATNPTDVGGCCCLLVEDQLFLAEVIIYILLIDFAAAAAASYIPPKNFPPWGSRWSH